MRRIGFFVLALSLAALGPVWGQQQGGGSSGGGSGNQGNTGQSPGGERPTGGDRQGGAGQQSRDPFGQRQQRIPEMPRAVYISGKVVLDNGEVPPEPVTIVQVCNGQGRPETYTDSKGRFSYEVGGNSTIALTDAAYSGAGGLPGQPNRGGIGGFGSAGIGGVDAFGGVDLSGCEVRAELPGFLSDAVQLGRRRPLDNPDIGVIVLRKIGGYDGAAISVTTMEAPKKARKQYDKAMRELRKDNGKLDKAAGLLEEAVAEYPRFALAWTYLGETRMQLEDPGGAAEAFEKAIEADPQYLKPYVSLTRMRLQQEDWAAVNELSEAVLARNPAASQYRYFQAAALFNLQRLEEAEEAVRAIENRGDDEEFPQTHQMLGMIHARRGMFEQAATEFRTYLQLAPNASSGEQIRSQLNEWEALGVIDKGEAAAAAQQ